MVRDIKITIAGAGSNFTMGFLGDLKASDLWGCELVLYDISDEKLRVMEKIARRYLEHAGMNLRVSATSNKVEAFEGSDFVIVTIRTRGIEALRRFIEIPLRHGILQVVGDTTGPSGILKGLFEAPAVLEIARTLEDLSPRALMINFTNPMTAICRTVLRGSKIRIVGLCHGIYQIVHLASELLDLDPQRIKPDAFGINHLTWVTSIKHDGEEVLDRLKESVRSGEKQSVIEASPYLIGRQLLAAYGHLPTLNDRHTSEFFHYLYEWFKEPRIRRALMESSGYIDYERKALDERIVQKRTAEWDRLRRAASGDEPIEIKPSNEAAVSIISSIINDRRRNILAANIPNDSCIEGVPSGCVVEVPAVVDGQGVRCAATARLSRSALAILNLHLQKFELFAEGIIEESKSLILESMAIDPLTTSPEKAETILREFLKESEELLAIKLR